MTYEDHGDPSVDERWRRALTREQAATDMDTVDRHAAEVGRTSGNVWDHVHPLNDLYVPEHERLEPIVGVDELLEDIVRHGA